MLSSRVQCRSQRLRVNPDRINLDQVSSHPLFEEIDKTLVAQAAQRAVFRRVSKNVVLFTKGDEESSNLYLLLEGAVRVSTALADGRTGYTYVVFPGDIFGEVGMFDGRPRICDAVSVESSEIVGLDRRDLIPLLRACPELSMRLLEIVCDHLRNATEQVDDMSLTLSRRLAKALLYLHGHSTNQRVHVTQNVMSQMIGAARETTNKQLQVWKKMNILSITRSGVVVRNPQALRNWQ